MWCKLQKKRTWKRRRICIWECEQHDAWAEWGRVWYWWGIKSNLGNGENEGWRGCRLVPSSQLLGQLDINSKQSEPHFLFLLIKGLGLAEQFTSMPTNTTNVLMKLKHLYLLDRHGNWVSNILWHFLSYNGKHHEDWWTAFISLTILLNSVISSK